MVKYEFHHPDANIKTFWDYDWWFWVSGFTVGFGDRFPVTEPGRLAARLVFVCCIATIAILAAKGIEYSTEKARKRMRGASCVPEDWNDHTVIFGDYVPGLTDRLIKALRANDDMCRVVLVVSNDGVLDNPSPKEIRFVRGDVANADPYVRSRFGHAARVVAFGSSDNETLARVMAARFHNKDAHVVAAAIDMPYLKAMINMFNAQDQSKVDVACVPAATPYLIIDELTDPGSFAIVDDLSDDSGGHNRNHIDIPEGYGPWDWEDFCVYLMRIGARFEATLPLDGTAAADHTPPTVQGGQRLFYVSRKPLSPADFNWEAIPVTTAS